MQFEATEREQNVYKENIRCRQMLHRSFVTGTRDPVSLLDTNGLHILFSLPSCWIFDIRLIEMSELMVKKKNMYSLVGLSSISYHHAIQYENSADENRFFLIFVE